MSISICGLVAENTGGIDCDVVRGNPMVLIAGSGTYSSADYVDETTFEAAFTGDIKQSNGTLSKLFPFPVIQGVTDRTEAAKYGTLGYGLSVKLLRSKQGYEFDVLAGSALEKRLIAWDGKQVPFYTLDDASNIWGTKATDGTFSGAIFQVGVEPRGWGDAQNVKTTKITLSIVDSRDWVENAAFMTTSFGALDLKGLNDVVLKEPVAHASNVHYIKAYVPTAQLGNGLDITEEFGTALFTASLWSAFTGATFSTPLTITSVSYDATNKRGVFTFDTTLYSALGAAAKIKLVPDPVPDLDAADVTGIEIQFIILTK